MSTPDSAAPLSALERRLLALLAVPADPEAPDGSPGSIQIFHAGHNFYLWSVIGWAARTVAVLIGQAVMTVAVVAPLLPAARWIQIAGTALLAVLWAVSLTVALVTFVARRINYLLRWYIVTDRSLRIRFGVFRIEELTMTYSNIQEIRVTSGPLQHLLGLADVEVQAAGGGAAGKHDRGGHTGRFEGLANANAVRDLLQARLRQYRDAGLGDTAHAVAAAGDGDELDAARLLLSEARALRAAIVPALGGQA